MRKESLAAAVVAEHIPDMLAMTQSAGEERLCRRCGIMFIVLTEEDAQSDYCPVCRRLLPPPGWTRGLLRWFDRRKGFGLILTRDGRSVYLKRAQLPPSHRGRLKRGALLSLRVQKSKHGWQAQEVRWPRPATAEPIANE